MFPAAHVTGVAILGRKVRDQGHVIR